MKQIIKTLGLVAALTSLIGVIAQPVQATTKKSKSNIEQKLNCTVFNEVIDESLADNGSERYQNIWINNFNSQKGEYKGKRQMTAIDFYRADDSVLPRLRKDCKYQSIFGLVPATSYKLEIDLEGHVVGSVVQNRRSTVVMPTKSLPMIIPVYDKTPLPKVLETKEGLACVQALFDTNDNKEKIMERLSHLTRRNPEKILFSTPRKNAIKYRSVCQIKLEYTKDEEFFHINGEDIFDIGYTHGVSIVESQPSMVPISTTLSGEYKPSVHWTW